MLKIMRKNKKGQNTAEYAAIMAIVIAAVITMQTYVRRGFQGGVKLAVDKMQRSGSAKGQYEPPYLESKFLTSSPKYSETEETKLDGEVIRVYAVDGTKQTTRTGYQKIRAAK